MISTTVPKDAIILRHEKMVSANKHRIVMFESDSDGYMSVEEIMDCESLEVLWKEFRKKHGFRLDTDELWLINGVGSYTKIKLRSVLRWFREFAHNV